jgi:hypothetical protein
MEIKVKGIDGLKIEVCQTCGGIKIFINNPIHLCDCSVFSTAELIMEGELDGPSKP